MHAGHTERIHQIARQETARERATIALGLLAFCTGVIVLLLALALGWPIEATPSDLLDTTKSQQIAIPAVISVVVGVVACAGRRRGWALTVGWVGAAAAVVAVLLTVLLPGGDQLAQSLPKLDSDVLLHQSSSRSD